jgi:hypothetical protein
MSTPQDAPNRKKQKVRAARKLEQWRAKQGTQKVAGATAAAVPAKKK